MKKSLSLIISLALVFTMIPQLAFGETASGLRLDAAFSQDSSAFIQVDDKTGDMESVLTGSSIEALMAESFDVTFTGSFKGLKPGSTVTHYPDKTSAAKSLMKDLFYFIPDTETTIPVTLKASDNSAKINYVAKRVGHTYTGKVAADSDWNGFATLLAKILVADKDAKDILVGTAKDKKDGTVYTFKMNNTVMPGYAFKGKTTVDVTRKVVDGKQYTTSVVINTDAITKQITNTSTLVKQIKLKAVTSPSTLVSGKILSAANKVECKVVYGSKNVDKLLRAGYKMKYKFSRATAPKSTYYKRDLTTKNEYRNNALKPNRVYYYKCALQFTSPTGKVYTTSLKNCQYSARKVTYKEYSKALSKNVKPAVKATKVKGKTAVKLTSRAGWGKTAVNRMTSYGYKVQYGVYKATSKNGKMKLVKFSKSKTYVDKNVKAGKTYYYKTVMKFIAPNGAVVKTPLKACKVQTIKIPKKK